MENSETDEHRKSPTTIEQHDVKDSGSSENFQHFIYDLFEKNGILNDLRAYLREHIINVLQNANTGEASSCQKHFTQRLQRPFQAINILIAEYLLCLELSYSLSVFVSEIPLSNMVFEFAKSLMQIPPHGKAKGLKFQKSDICSVLNYLGVQCDSEYVANVLEMYKRGERSPLLMCILKCIPMYQISPTNREQAGVPLEDSLSSTDKSTDAFDTEDSKTNRKKLFQDKCRHHIMCKTCQLRITRLKDKYKRRKKMLAKMFDQLKGVYETELEMVKTEERKYMKRSLANHALMFQEKQHEMEESLKAREEELERNMQQKKQFLWDLARTLREQHRQMSSAMNAVKRETEMLSAKEESLKNQLSEAENVLRQRGEEMRQQISNELAQLQIHLESMKCERDNINKEILLLENLKSNSNKNILNREEYTEELTSHYDVIKKEFQLLKKYIDVTKLEPKCVIERATITDIRDVKSKLSIILNNEQEIEKIVRNGEDQPEKTPNQVMNDLKKKNVNFSISKLDELYRERSRDRSRSSASSEAGDATTSERVIADFNTRRLQEENQRLRELAWQQGEHISSLTSERARLQASTWRRACPLYVPPASAPVLPPFIQTLRSRAGAGTSAGLRTGAGEELSIFSDAHPRVVLPSDHVPFVGSLLRTDRHNDRRSCTSTWRAYRRRVSPLGSITKVRARSPLQRTISPARVLTAKTEEAIPMPSSTLKTEKGKDSDNEQNESEPVYNPNQSMSGKLSKREKSPNSVLREAKVRLKKLEIEAEAVEKSYLDFRRQQSERKHIKFPDEKTVTENPIREIDIKRTGSHHVGNNDDIPACRRINTVNQERLKTDDLKQYLLDFDKKFNIGETSFNSRVTSSKSKTEMNLVLQQKKEPKTVKNYLETPLIEFRKLYHLNDNDYCKTSSRPNSSYIEVEETSQNSNSKYMDDVKQKAEMKIRKELEILKHNINKMYNIKDNNEELDTVNEENLNPGISVASLSDNLLRVEVESVCESNKLSISQTDTRPEDDVLLFVKSSMDQNEAMLSDGQSDDEVIAPCTAIIVSPRQERLTEVASRVVKSPEPISPKQERRHFEESSKKSPEHKIPKEETLHFGETNVKPRNQGKQHFEDSKQSTDTKSMIQEEIVVKLPEGSPKQEKHFEETDQKLPDHKRSISPEQAAKLTRNDVLNAIFEDGLNVPGVEIDLDLAKSILEDNLSQLEEGNQDDYTDNFSADVDNYNSRTDYNATLSPHKTSEDEDNFWDS